MYNVSNNSVIHRSECSENDFKSGINTTFPLSRSSSISLPERLITLAETNGSRYDYEGRGEIVPVDAECTTSDVTDVIFFPSSKAGPTVGRGGGGENNLKAELNFSSSESFVRALGGGQWLNGDVSRKVDSRERPALYRPSIHPLLALHPLLPLRESADARARGSISSRKNIY